MTDTIKAYKAFEADMTCRGFAYEVGKTYEQDGKIEACGNGFHACENPFDVWSYYPVVGEDGKLTRYAKVIMSGDMDKGNDKIAAGKITIEAEIKLPEFIRAAVTRLIDAVNGKVDDPDGYNARIGSSGDYARIGSSGDSARIGSSGYNARIGSSGDSAQIGSSGHYAQIGSSGDYARIGSSGDYARIGSSGYNARIVAEGENAVIACAGIGATVTAGPNGAICIPWHDGKRTRFAVGYVGEDGIEAGVAYRADDTGKLVEAS